MHRLRKNDRGAAAVEFALVILPLMLLLMGIIEYGRVFSLQGTVTNAARVAARTMAITNSSSQAITDAGTAATANALVDSTLMLVKISPSTCTAGGLETVTAIYPDPSKGNLQQLSGYLPPALFPVRLTGTGVMRCGG